VAFVLVLVDMVQIHYDWDLAGQHPVFDVVVEYKVFSVDVDILVEHFASSINCLVVDSDRLAPVDGKVRVVDHPAAWLHEVVQSLERVYSTTNVHEFKQPVVDQPIRIHDHPTSSKSAVEDLSEINGSFGD
jgi:hypothetical protein